MSNSLLNKGYTDQISDKFSELSTNLIDLSREVINGKTLYGRVIRVVLDNTDPDWETLGYDKALYGVYYQPLKGNVDNTTSNENNFAYCKDSNIRRIPVPNEIVKLSVEFDIENSLNEESEIKLMYWTEIVSSWNTPHFNPFPDPDREDKSQVYTANMKERGDILPLQLCLGDISIEGRYGQSIRMGGTDSEEDYSPISNKDNSGDPYMIIRNGQASLDSLEKEPYLFKNSEDEDSIPYAVNENINLDSSSIYLVSNHIVPLEQACDKRDSWTINTPPLANTYEGAQILLNSNRLFLNARENDIELSAQESVGINANKTINMDASDVISLDANKIYLGKDADPETEPTLKGASTVESLKEICSVLKGILTSLNTSNPASPTATISSYIAAASAYTPILENIVSKLDSLKSEKIFVE